MIHFFYNPYVHNLQDPIGHLHPPRTIHPQPHPLHKVTNLPKVPLQDHQTRSLRAGEVHRDTG